MSGGHDAHHGGGGHPPKEHKSHGGGGGKSVEFRKIMETSGGLAAVAAKRFFPQFSKLFEGGKNIIKSVLKAIGAGCKMLFRLFGGRG